MNKINFENLPSTTMPLNAESLNTMQDNIEAEINKLHTIVISDTAIDFDTLKDEGRYIFITGPTGNNAPTNQAGWLEVFAKGDFTLHRYTTFTGNEVRLRGFYYEKWYEWRLANHPNITTGTEYETGRFIDGKKEYAKRIDIGALPNATSKAVAHGLNLSNIKFTAPPIGVASQSSGYTIPLPSISTSAQSWNVAILVEPTTIKITTGQNYSAYTGNVELKYTKNS